MPSRKLRETGDSDTVERLHEKDRLNLRRLYPFMRDWPADADLPAKELSDLRSGKGLRPKVPL
jgi:hypothetical protein